MAHTEPLGEKADIDPSWPTLMIANGRFCSSRTARPEEERDCAFELTHFQQSRRGPDPLEEAPDKLSELRLHAAFCESRVGIDPSISSMLKPTSLNPLAT